MVAGTGGRKKAGPAKPPEKGAFPLDHGGECKTSSPSTDSAPEASILNSRVRSQKEVDM